MRCVLIQKFSRAIGAGLLKSGAVLIALAAGAPAVAQAAIVTPEILADTNRDGKVDNADRAGREQWTTERGAIILPNIGDSAKRCPSYLDKNHSDAALEACNDAQGNVARAPQYFAPVRTSPLSNVSSSAFGQVTVSGAGKDKIRVFVLRGKSWHFLSSTDRLSAAELRAGVTLGVDSRDIVRDASVWDGRVTLEFAVNDAGAVRQDRVAMRVAPVILHNHTQDAVTIYAPKSGRAKGHQQFMADLSAMLSRIGFQEPVETVDTFDNWAQDFVEFGYVSMPAAGGGMTSIRIAIRSPQPGRSAGRALFGLRGPGMGVVQTGGDDYHQADSFGNLETIPPYEFQGRSYPVGRVIYGDAGDGLAPHTDFVKFFKAQDVQHPIVLDTSWLAIAHVDEFVQFLPADNARGWVIAVKDVPLALNILRDMQKRGLGRSKAFSREGAPELTIDELLADESLMRKNEMARRRIELNLDILKAEIGVADAEIVRVPGLFHTAEFVEDAPKDASEKAKPFSLPSDLDWPRERIVYGPGKLIGYYPAAVNGLLVNRRNYIMPDQWGPKENGRDVLGAAATAAYAKLGMMAGAGDDWVSHHAYGGEGHCGTNATRAISGTWWSSASGD